MAESAAEAGDPRMVAVREAMASGELDQAERILDEYLLEHPEAHLAYQFKAEVLWQRGQPEEAIAYLREKIGERPELPALYVTLGQALWAAQEHEPAIKALEAYLEIVPEAPESRVVRNMLDSFKDFYGDPAAEE
jgi:predicted Zn-dependent protease